MTPAGVRGLVDDEAMDLITSIADNLQAGRETLPYLGDIIGRVKKRRAAGRIWCQREHWLDDHFQSSDDEDDADEVAAVAVAAAVAAAAADASDCEAERATTTTTRSQEPRKERRAS